MMRSERESEPDVGKRGAKPLEATFWRYTRKQKTNVFASH